MKKIIFSLTLAVGLLPAARAQVQFYYSQNLTATNLVITGVSNLISANYPASGGWLTTRGVTPTDLNANAVAFQFVTQPNQAQATPVNLTATIGLSLDDQSVVSRYPPATNWQFTVTTIVQGQTAPASTHLASIGATNFLGAKCFKVLSLNYAGVGSVKVLSARAGYWH